jgi:hypothetical protein
MSPGADVELILDVRELDDPPHDRDGFLTLWARVERALRGQDLRAMPACVIDAGTEGKIRLEAVRVAVGAGPVSAATRFSVVAVRENALLRHRCKECATQGVERYGSFPCSVSAGGAHRACDQHVKILDGSLTPTCGAHRPRCHDRGCGQLATFRCAGRVCRRETAWCDQHRRSRPHEPDFAYCPSCYAREFPPCQRPGCTAIGTLACEHLSSVFTACGRRMCARHAWRWQVFGGERLGLGRCSTHRNVTRLASQDLIFQIVAGSAARRRRERLPSLHGFAYTLRRARHPDLALDYRGILDMLARLAATLDRSAAGRAAAQLIRDMWPTWERQLKEIEAAAVDGERLLTRLRQLIRSEFPQDGPALAAAISLAEYRPARVRAGTRRRAMLFVHVPPDRHEVFNGAEDRRRRRYEAVLGVSVHIEGGRRSR